MTDRAQTHPLRRPSASVSAALFLALSLLLIPAAANGKGKGPTFERTTDAVVRTGAELPRLLGAVPSQVQAYRFKPKGKAGRWIRVAVQVDERALVDFGRNPANGSVPLTGEPTVYGTPPLGQVALQYTDPDTFVGPDPDRVLDRDDEIVFMAADAGARAPKRAGHPRLAQAKGSSRVAIADPLNGSTRWIYLFRGASKKKKGGKSGAKQPDLVSYDFHLSSGDYRSTYQRRNGPNPESSSISTAFYRAGFSDRWYFDQLRLTDGGATGADILDGYKVAFSSGGCGRSEATFNAAEGAFVVNKDGPVRAIRSYVGANSGPYTQRTHFFYAKRQEIVTDLRVHSIPGPFTHYDLSPAGAGMTYLDQAHPGGVTVDGVPDPVASGGAPVDWHLWRGGQGSLFVGERVTSTFQSSVNAGSSFFYEDNSSAPSFAQCWGDPDLFGASGVSIGITTPNTDVGAPDSLRARSVNVYAAPGATAANADLWSRQLDTPLQVSAKRFKG